MLSDLPPDLIRHIILSECRNCKTRHDDDMEYALPWEILAPLYSLNQKFHAALNDRAFWRVLAEKAYISGSVEDAKEVILSISANPEAVFLRACRVGNITLFDYITTTHRHKIRKLDDKYPFIDDSKILQHPIVIAAMCNHWHLISLYIVRLDYYKPVIRLMNAMGMPITEREILLVARAVCKIVRDAVREHDFMNPQPGITLFSRMIAKYPSAALHYAGL